jgi:tryptophan-rich hypothetical protein
MAKKQKFPYLLDSKWTAKTKMWGWRHFRVVNRKNEGKWVFAEMVAACDPEVKFWVNARSLKDPVQWQAGWQTLAEMQSNEPEKSENDLPYLLTNPQIYQS